MHNILVCASLFQQRQHVPPVPLGRGMQRRILDPVWADPSRVKLPGTPRELLGR